MAAIEGPSFSQFFNGDVYEKMLLKFYFFPWFLQVLPAAVSISMKLILGGRSKHISCNGVQVTVIDNESLPYSAEVMVFEEDTHLILTADREIHYQEEHPIRLMTDIMNARKNRLGSLVVNDRSWYAVVIDVNAETMCQPQSVSEAYINVFAHLNSKKIVSAGMHLLGLIHGKMVINQAVNLFLGGLHTQNINCLRHIWVVVSTADIKATRKAIAQNHLTKNGL
jgi:hypothetical protein